jgi:hypothetical protein
MADLKPTLDGDLYFGGPDEFRELLYEAAGAIQRFVTVPLRIKVPS